MAIPSKLKQTIGKATRPQKFEVEKGQVRRFAAAIGEEDPIHNPEIYNVVTAPWVMGNTLMGGVWCAEVRLGRPTIESLRDLEDESGVSAALEEAFEDFDPLRPPLVIEPDGTSDWVTFLLTDAPPDTPIEEIRDLDLEAEYSRIELIVEGATGLAWMQRPLYEEELDLFEEKGWPVVLRQDFLDPRVLTEDDVLELRDVPTN